LQLRLQPNGGHNTRARTCLRRAARSHHSAAVEVRSGGGRYVLQTLADLVVIVHLGFNAFVDVAPGRAAGRAASFAVGFEPMRAAIERRSGTNPSGNDATWISDVDAAEIPAPTTL
jgi:hypothetical protein